MIPESGAPLLVRRHPPPALIEEVDNALVAPVGEGRNLPLGVFRADGSFCDHSRNILTGNRFTDIPNVPVAQDLMAGRHLYAGLGRAHFGHFLLESITRLWALEQGHAHVESLVFVPMRGINLTARLTGAYRPLYRALGFDKPCRMVIAPTQVERLLVPTQGFGHRAWIAGTPEFRKFVRDRLSAHFTADGPEKLFVSRTRLRGDTKRVDQEKRIEREMKRAGYTVFHPQDHPIDVQISRYMAARQIVGADGSAFHLAAFVLQPGSRIALIKRRDHDKVFRSFLDQMAAFCQVEAIPIDATIPRDQRPDPFAIPAPINFRKVRRQLRKAGFV